MIVGRMVEIENDSRQLMHQCIAPKTQHLIRHSSTDSPCVGTTRSASNCTQGWIFIGVVCGRLCEVY